MIETVREEELSNARRDPRSRSSGGAPPAEPLPDATGMTSWFVVRTKRHKERLAQVRLVERGVETYLPMLHQWPRPAVG
jgi:hypothetical protein